MHVKTDNVTSQIWCHLKTRMLFSPGQTYRVSYKAKVLCNSMGEHIKAAHARGKKLLVHIDLAEGIGKDEAGVRYLAGLGCDGIISTRAQIIKYAKKEGLFTVQRFFTLDSQGLEGIDDMLSGTRPSMMEIMPGVITKTISRFSKSDIPVIAGGLIESKEEATAALGAGAMAVSTGREELWYL